MSTPSTLVDDMPLTQHIPDHVEDLRDHDPITDTQDFIPGSTHVTSMGIMVFTFLVNRYFVLIKIPKILGI